MALDPRTGGSDPGGPRLETRGLDRGDLACGSDCWFTAFTLENAGYVFAVGQVEVILSLMASVLFFHEKISRKEVFGIGLITLSVVVLIAVT